MVDLKPDVNRALNGIEGVKAFFFYPETFKNLPCVNFYEADNSPGSFADDDEYAARITYVVDVWAKTDAETSGVAGDVNAAMKSLGFVREFCADVANPDSGVRHKTMRFATIKGVE